jgi:L-lactate dehydrogenase complex protein LldF
MRPFEERYERALADSGIAAGLLAFQRAWRVARDAQIAELERDTGRSFDDLRHELAGIKADVLANWEEYMERFTRHAETAGATVVRVAAAAEACDYVARLCAKSGAPLVVKGKSMVSEEIALNQHLEAAGIAAIETDLGEWLLQLDHDHPSHLVMPAIHKRRGQIAALLTTVLGREFDPDDIVGMVRSARTELRDRFLEARVGLSGANALIAESGTVMLVCNEGNNRMSVALPGVHIVTAGIEKLLPDFAAAMLQARLLARSATGQLLTTYTNFVTGPRPGQEQHILLIDNGRRAMAEEPGIVTALGCIRCGACANVCPPYQVVGGHAFGYVYTGAIGLVNTAFHHGIEAAAGPQSLCVSCGACATVCPAEIPLPTQILEVRRAVVAQLRQPLARRLGLRLFSSRRLVGIGARLAALVTLPFRRNGMLRLPAIGKRLREQLSWRTPPAIPLRPARARLGRRGRGRPLARTAVSGKRVVLFLQCVTDRVAPDIAVAAAALLEAAGAEVYVPPGQHCCGLPAYDTGNWISARRMAAQTLDTLRGADLVVTPAPSCVVAMAHDYARLFADDPTRRGEAERLAERVHDLVSFLAGPARLPDGALDNGDHTPVTVHRFCQSGNVLGMRGEMEDLVQSVANVPVSPLPENGVCCGFGGSTSLTAPAVAAGILDRKLRCVDESGASVLVTDNPGCVLHMRGGAHASGRSVRVLHVAEFLAGRIR